jgi:hypothetical protein
MDFNRFTELYRGYGELHGCSPSLEEVLELVVHYQATYTSYVG